MIDFCHAAITITTTVSTTGKEGGKHCSSAGVPVVGNSEFGELSQYGSSVVKSLRPYQ